MCDYSLHAVKSRKAKVGDKLVSTAFADTVTRGFADVGEPDVAVCMLPGTELAFEQDVMVNQKYRFMPKTRLRATVARFTQVSVRNPNVHHDALEFPGLVGQSPVLVTNLIVGQRVTVLQLPAQKQSGGGDEIAATTGHAAVAAAMTGTEHPRDTVRA
jgi:hypothetical protein